MTPAFFVFFGYLCGSVPFGMLLAKRLTGVDVREKGSGNIGATNVARVAGKKLGGVVLFLDAVKGALPVVFSLWLRPDSPLLHAEVGMAAVLGHVFPVWLRFRGGKGVATALGVLSALLPFSALVGLMGFAAVFALFRVSSLGSLSGGALALASAFVLYRLGRAPLPYAILCAGLLPLLLFTHRSNLKRLVARTESRF